MFLAAQIVQTWGLGQIAIFVIVALAVIGIVIVAAKVSASKSVEQQ